MISRVHLTRLCALLKPTNARNSGLLFLSAYTTSSQSPPASQVQDVCNIVSTSIGSLDDLESSLDKFDLPLTTSLVVEIVKHCKDTSPSRRLLRFFTWSCKRLNKDLVDEDYNFAIRAFAERKDSRAIDILLSDLRKENRILDAQTFCVVVDVLVKLGREDDALGIFKNLDKFGCPQNMVTVSAIITALCARGHARKAEGVLWHHSDKISSMNCVYRSLLYGWSVQVNIKEARRILQEMKSNKVMPDLYCYNTFLRCLCESNMKRNPSGLVPEALNVMMEMRSYKIMPNAISYNILLSCLGRARRVKESLKIFELMKRSGCNPDWVIYYLAAKVLYLSGRFGKGNQMVEEMMEAGVEAPPKFYHGLVGLLCGVERVNFALELLERMKKSSVREYGPVYDVLIPKLCRAGDFVKGKDLWNEAEELGVTLCCSKSVLDPSVTEVFVRERVEDQVRISVDDEVVTPNRNSDNPETSRSKKKMYIKKKKMRTKRNMKKKRKSLRG